MATMRATITAVLCLAGSHAFSPAKLISVEPLARTYSVTRSASVPPSESLGAEATPAADAPVTAAPKLIHGEVDEAALLAASTFPIAPPALISRAKEVLEAGVGTKDGGACLAESFQFCAAVVGPLGKDEYLRALGTFQLEDAFPDLFPNYHGFRVDPFQPSRVWFHTLQTATHTAPLMGKPPTGKVLVLPPQCFHLDFDEAGLVTEVGFYVVDRQYGNTGGLGGAFGFFYGTGNPLPIPECQPYRPSRRFRLLNFVGRTARRFSRS